MFGLDDKIAHLGTGGSVLFALVLAVLLGLRHATDPDHLTALATLVASDRQAGARRASRLGLAWGLGHATTLVVVGMPVVLLHRFLPANVQRGAEAAVGLIIAGLAVRLLVRWRRGQLHAHPHHHPDVVHAHPHVHANRIGGDSHGQAHQHLHDHAHAERLGRSPAAAFGIGVVHGLGGSAGVGILLIGAMPDHAAASVALVLFAGATAVSMALISGAWGRLLAAGRVAPRLAVLAPIFGVLSLAFGVWYAALSLV